MSTTSRPTTSFVPAKNEASRGAKTHGMTTRRSALGNITNQQGGMDPSVKAHKAKATSSNSIKTSVPQQRIGEVKARSSSTRNVARSSSTTTRTQKMHHVDLADRMDPQTAAEYAQDIFNYHRQVESRYAPSAIYMSRQSDINERMRAILIDWLVEVHLKFKLEKETLFLTVHLIDRLLQLKAVKREKLQLVGVTAMLIASKYEEIYAPEVRDFVYISDNAYTNDEILAMEALMLNAFKFRITTPSILSFLGRFTKIMGADSTVSKLSQYFAESMLQEYSMLRYPSSTIAAASVAVARKTIGKTYWNGNLEKIGQYTEAELTPCITEIIELMKGTGSGRKSNLQAVKKKFSSARFGEVALLTIPTAL